MRVSHIIAAIASISILPSAMAQTSQSRTAAQADGMAVGSSALSTGPMTPQAMSNSATTPGTSNVWGSAYTGSPDQTLTQKQGASSLIGIGNEARSTAVSTFSGYNNDRSTQASQATYFLDRNPVLKPQLSSSDPIFNTSKIVDSSGLFASTTQKTCKQETTTPPRTSQEYSCFQSYLPYVVTCTSTANVTTSTVPTCTLGQTLTINMGDTTGMGRDSFWGGDILVVQWGCTTADYPTITMLTNGLQGGYVGGVVPNKGEIVVDEGSRGQALKFINDTTCIDKQCSGTYTMVLGTMQPVYTYPSYCVYDPYWDTMVDGSGNGMPCDGTYVGNQFVERSWGASSRIVSHGAFAMAQIVTSTTVTDDCAPYQALAN